MISCLAPDARAKGQNERFPVSPLSAKPVGRQPVDPWAAIPAPPAPQVVALLAVDLVYAWRLSALS